MRAELGAGAGARGGVAGAVCECGCGEGVGEVGGRVSVSACGGAGAGDVWAVEGSDGGEEVAGGGGGGGGGVVGGLWCEVGEGEDYVVGVLLVLGGLRDDGWRRGAPDLGDSLFFW